MTLQYIPYTRSKSSVRRTRELETVRVMVRLYCRGHGHHGAHDCSEGLCADCGTLMEYARRRLARCVFGDAKPTCANCVVHCYSAAMREQVRMVMRRAGPRMLLRHPLLGIRHLLGGRRAVPVLPVRPAVKPANVNNDS
jgi:hypothetical protein